MSVLLELDTHSQRVLGALLEKEQTTPDYYPLTLKALIAACNQTTNREPILALKQFEVLAALHVLERVSLVQRVTGPRADRWSHLLIQPAVARPAPKALITVLLLRGPQTIGELKGRTDRMHPFSSLEEVETALQALAGAEPPLVREIPRRPGQKESRWMLNLPDTGEVTAAVPRGEPVDARPSAAASASADTSPSLAERVRRLEEELAALRERIDTLEA